MHDKGPVCPQMVGVSYLATTCLMGCYTCVYNHITYSSCHQSKAPPNHLHTWHTEITQTPQQQQYSLAQWNRHNHSYFWAFFCPIWLMVWIVNSSPNNQLSLTVAMAGGTFVVMAGIACRDSPWSEWCGSAKQTAYSTHTTSPTWE